jgi:hypothetical protein
METDGKIYSMHFLFFVLKLRQFVHIFLFSHALNYCEMYVFSVRPVFTKLCVATPWGGAELRQGRRQKTREKLKRKN